MHYALALKRSRFISEEPKKSTRNYNCVRFGSLKPTPLSTHSSIKFPLELLFSFLYLFLFTHYLKTSLKIKDSLHDNGNLITLRTFQFTSKMALIMYNSDEKTCAVNAHRIINLGVIATTNFDNSCVWPVYAHLEIFLVLIFYD